MWGRGSSSFETQLKKPTIPEVVEPTSKKTLGTSVINSQTPLPPCPPPLRYLIYLGGNLDTSKASN